jgi:hypothetical protein
VSSAARTNIPAAAGAKPATRIPAASLVLYLALALAMLTGLVVSGTLFLGG